MNNPLLREYNKLATRFDELSVREQVMILLCSITLVVFVAYFVLLEPQWQQNATITKNITRNQQDVAALAEQTQDLTKALQQDPNVSIKQRIGDIQQQISVVETQLALQTANLVQANKMPQMLEKVLASSDKLTLISLQSIPPHAISFTQNSEPQGNSGEAALYRHGVKLIVEGSYFEVQSYLEKLEALEWQFYWKKFDYKVSEYPVATVELEIYTLSTNKAFIGV